MTATKENLKKGREKVLETRRKNRESKQYQQELAKARLLRKWQALSLCVSITLSARCQLVSLSSPRVPALYA